MPRKATKPRKQRGKGIVGDAARYIKDNKLLSKGLGMIPHPAAQAAAQVAALFGLGRPLKAAPKKRKQRGRGIFGDIGGGIGSVFGGLGSGIGSIVHGFFGGGRRPPLAMIVGRPVVPL